MEMLRCDDSSVAYINFYPRYTSLHIGEKRGFIRPEQKPVPAGQCGKSREGKTGIFFLSGSRSERGICFILFVCAASLVKNMNIATNSYLEIR